MSSVLAARLGDRLRFEPVRDLWPRNLIAARAGQGPELCALVRPSSREQVADALHAAAEAGVRVVPVGGRTGVCGAVDVGVGELALDLSGLDRILEVDEVNLSCRVEAGVRLADLESELNRRGLTHGHHPTSLAQATVGGAISTRSSGQESTRYGSIEDMLLGVTAMLADGSVLPLRSHPRSAAGPALHQLLVGAEGTLAVILEASLRVSRMPAAVRGRGYRFESPQAGLGAMREIVQCGLRPLVARLYDADDSLLQGLDGGCLMVVACAGEAELAEAESRVVARICGPGTDLGEGPWLRWLTHRYDLSAKRMLDLLQPAGAVLDTIELGASWSSLPSLHGDIKGALSGSGLTLCHFSHPSPQGCCAYFTFAGSEETEARALERYDRVWDVAMGAARAHGASITHHHGVGQVRSPWIAGELGTWSLVWDAIRRAADPAGRLNPRGVGGA